MGKNSKANDILHMQHLPEYQMLLRLAWPVVLSLLVQGVYSLVDSIYLSRLGEEVLSAVSLSFVVQGFASSFFSGIAIGMNAVISRALGAGRNDDAKRAVISGSIAQITFVAAFMLLGFFGTAAYFTGTTDHPMVIEYGIRYLKPCLILVFGSAAQVTLERLLQSTGLTRYMVYTQVSGVVVNLVLDPIMIFGLLGCPALGVEGAAYATVIGQFVAAGTALWFNLRHNPLLFQNLRIRANYDFKTMLEICRIGIPTAAMGISSAIGNYFINRILVGFSATANAAFGVYAKLQSIAVMPTQGMSAAMVTILSFFYGKRDLNRINRTLWYGEAIVGVWNVVCFLVFMFAPIPLLNIFDPSPQMLEVGVPAFRIIGTTYLTSGLMTGFIAFFQASGRSISAFFTSLFRQIFVRIPVAYWLATFNRVELLWWCWPISEVTSDIACVVLFIICYRKFAAELKASARLCDRSTKVEV